MKIMDKRVTFRNGRFYVRGTNIRVDLLVGLGAEKVLENYPWLTEEQVKDALIFAKDLISQKGKSEASAQKLPTL